MGNAISRSSTSLGIIIFTASCLLATSVTGQPAKDKSDDIDKAKQKVLKKMQAVGTTPATIADMISTLYKHRLELEIDQIGIRTRMKAIEVAVLEQRTIRTKIYKAQLGVKEVEIEEAKNLLRRRQIELDNATKLADKAYVGRGEVDMAKANLMNAETLVRKKTLELQTIAATNVEHLNELLIRASIDNEEIEARFAFVTKRLASLQELVAEYHRLPQLNAFGREN